MADLCCAYTYAGVILNNPDPDANHLMLGEDGVTGLDGAPIRSEIDDQGQSDGGIVHPKLYGPRIITFKGFVNIVTELDKKTAAYSTALNVLEAAVTAALEAQLNSAAALTWTPTGGSGKSISCTYGNSGGEIRFGGSHFEKTFEFTLVAADPTIT